MHADAWFGIYRELLSFLTVVNADKDADGRPIVRGSVTLFMGVEDENNDVVVGGDAKYYVDGEAKNLAAGLRTTSYGLAIKVM